MFNRIRAWFGRKEDAPIDVGPVSPHDFSEWASRVASGASGLAQPDTCPECKQCTYYTVNRDPNNRPLKYSVQRCTNCGWPLMQAGSLHGALTHMDPIDKTVTPARQLRDHVVVVQYNHKGEPVAQFDPQPDGSFI